jgi:predicted nucleic acid-binding protein
VKRYVLDSSAVIAFLEDRNGAQVVEDLLEKAAGGHHILHMSVVNWGEIYSAICRATGPETASRKMEELEHLPIELVDADGSLTRSAAELSAYHKLPYLGCIGVAAAQARKATFVTADREFESVGDAVRLLFV